MPLAVRALPLIVVSGGVSLSPQGIKHVSQWFRKTFLTTKTVSAPPRATSTSEPISSPSLKSLSQPQVQQALQELIRKEEYKGCSAFENNGRSTALYICVKELKNGTNKPHLYYYDRGRTSQLLQVKHLSINKQGYTSKKITMYFEKGSSQPLAFPPTWARLWTGNTFTPDSDCSINKLGNSSYSLSCGRLVKQTIHT